MDYGDWLDGDRVRPTPLRREHELPTLKGSRAGFDWAAHWAALDAAAKAAEEAAEEAAKAAKAAEIVAACDKAGYAGFVPVNAAIAAAKVAVAAFEQGEFSGKGQSKRYQAAKMAANAAIAAAQGAFNGQLHAIAQGVQIGLLTEEQAGKARTSLSKLGQQIRLLDIE